MSNGSKKMNALQQQYEKEKQEKQSKQAKSVKNEITAYQIKNFIPILFPSWYDPPPSMWEEDDAHSVTSITNVIHVTNITHVAVKL